MIPAGGKIISVTKGNQSSSMFGVMGGAENVPVKYEAQQDYSRRDEQKYAREEPQYEPQ